MRVDPNDGVCRSCGGSLTLIDADDATMMVDGDQWTEPFDCPNFREVSFEPKAHAIEN